MDKYVDNINRVISMINHAAHVMQEEDMVAEDKLSMVCASVNIISDAFQELVGQLQAKEVGEKTIGFDISEFVEEAE